MKSWSYRTASRLGSALLGQWTVTVFWVAVGLMLVVRLGESLIGTQVLVGFDMLDRFAPWSTLPTAGDRYDANPYVTDQIDSQLPHLIEMRERLAQGDWPLYSNMVQGGNVTLAVPSRGYLTPTRVAWLILPLTMAAGWVKLFEIAFGIGFTYLFVRRLGFARLPSAVSGFVFAFSGFIIAWSGWPQATVMSLVPMLFWAVERFIQDLRWRNLVPVALASAFMLLGGFPVVAGHSFVVVGIYAIIRAFGSTSSMTASALLSPLWALVRLGIGVVVGALASMVQLLPFIELTLARASLGYREGWSGSQDPLDSWLSVVLPVPIESAASYQDHSAYIGSVAFVLAAIGVLAYLRGGLPRGVGTFMIVVCVFVVAFISFQRLGGWGELINGLPLLANNPPGRLRAQLAMPVAVFVGLGVHWLMKESPRGEWRRFEWLAPGFRLPAAVAAGVATLVMVAALFVYSRQVGFWQNEPFREAVLFVLLPLGAVLIVWLIAMISTRMRNVALVLAAVAIVAQSLAPTAFFWPSSDPDEVYPEAGVLDFLAENVGHDQLATAGLVLRPNAPNVNGIRLANGHAFVSEPWREAMKEADPSTFGTGGTYSFLSPIRHTLFENPALDRLGVRYVAAAADEYYGERGVPVPLVGDADRDARVATVDDDQLSALGDRSTIALGDAAVNGVVVPMRLTGEVVVEAIAFAADGREIASNLVVFSSPGTEIELPVGLAIPEGEQVASIEVAVTPEPSEDGLAAVGVDRTDDGELVVWPNLVNEAMDEYPLVYAGENVLVWERESALSRIRLTSDALGAAPMSASDDVVIHHDDGDRISVTTNAGEDGFLAIAQVLDTGFEATVDGEPVEIAEGETGVYVIPVPAGEHDVEITFMPKSVPIGLTISLAALAIILFWALAGPIRGRIAAGALSRSRRADRRHGREGS